MANNHLEDLGEELGFFPTDSNGTFRLDLEPFGDEKGTSAVTAKAIHPKQRLQLARDILKGLAILAILGIGAGLTFPIFAYWVIGSGDPSIELKDYFAHGMVAIDFVTIVLPPIATLVIGYYFGQKQT